MKLLAFLLVAIVTMASCESLDLIELAPSTPRCEVALWCQDLETADRCEKVDYCKKWIWSVDPVSGLVSCDQCKEVIGELLAENKTIVDAICGLLPFGKSLCEEELEKLISGVTPQEICHALDMCNSSVPALKQLIGQLIGQLIEKQEAEPKDSCSICKLVAGLVLKNEDELKSVLDGLCNKTSIDTECELVVDAIFEELKNLNATQLCTDLKLCSSDQSKAAPHLLGADMCTRGPAYWCDSLDNAQECQAFDFCEKKVWI